MSKDLWVSEDGSWGLSEVKRFDSSQWAGEDFDALDEACDYDKLKVAKRIDKKYRKQAEEYAKRFFSTQFPEVRTFIYGDNGFEEVK